MLAATHSPFGNIRLQTFSRPYTGNMLGSLDTAKLVTMSRRVGVFENKGVDR